MDTDTIIEIVQFNSAYSVTPARSLQLRQVPPSPGQPTGRLCWDCARRNHARAPGRAEERCLSRLPVGYRDTPYPAGDPLVSPP
jgi:hypothetical protein